MSGSPPELPVPELGTGGGGTIDWTRIRGGGIGGPAELPNPELRVSATELVREVFRLRDRTHALENVALSNRIAASAVARSFFGGGIGGPQELPEGEGGGGGGGFHPPRGEINEIAELPINRFVAELSALSARFTQFETAISKQLTEIQAGIAKRGG